MKPSVILSRAALLCILILPLAAQPERPIPEILPGDAMLFVAAKDLTALRPWFEGKAGFFAEPSVQKMLKEAGLDAETLKREFVEEVKIPLDDFLDVLKGPAGASLFMKKDGHEDVPDVIMAFGVERGERSEALWRKLRTRLEDDADIERMTEEDIRGVSVWMVEHKRSAGEDEETPPSRAWLCLEEGAFLASTRRDLMERSLLALQGRELPTPAMTARKDYGRALQHLGSARDFLLFIDLPAILAAEGRGEEDAGFMKTMGLDTITGLWVGFGSAEDALEGVIYADAPGPRRGLMKLMSPECGALKPDRFAPADARQAGVLWIDPRTLLGEIRAMVVDMQGKEGAEMMDAMIEMMEQNAGVHLQDDLLALMEPPLYFVEMASPGGTAEALGPNRTIFYMRSPDPKKLAESLGTLMEAASDFGLELSDKEYLGHTITYLEIELPEELGAEGVTMPTPAFTTTGSHAFFTLAGTEPLERALRTIGKEVQPLSATADYQRAMKGLPQGSWMVSFARLSDTLGEVSSMLSGPGRMAGEDVPSSVLNFLSDADADFWRRYIDVLGMSMSSDASGITARMRILGPAKTKERQLR